MKMNSIRKKITISLMATVLVALLAVGLTSIALNYRSTIATVDRMMSETAVLASERIQQELTAYKNVAMDTGCISQLSDSTVSLRRSGPLLMSGLACTGFSGAMSSPPMAAVFLTAMITPTGSMSSRP